MWLRERADLTLMLCRPKLVVLTSIASFWDHFTVPCDVLEGRALRKDTRQVEIFFAMIVSVVYLKAPPSPKRHVRFDACGNCRHLGYVATGVAYRRSTDNVISPTGVIC